MKLPDIESGKILDPSLLDFIDYTRVILNSGRYQNRVVTAVPTWAASEGETVLYSDGNLRRVYYYINGQWNYAAYATTSGQNLIDLGSGNNLIGGNESDGFWVGASTFAAAPFRVSLSGAFTATNATLTGNIIASSGTIGGWSIYLSYLSAGSGSSAVGMTPGTYPFYAGNATPSLAPFYVSSTGAVFCSNLTVTGGAAGGWTITPSSIYNGSGSSRVGIDIGPYPFYAGSETPTAAPFFVTNTGIVTCTSIRLSGLLPGSAIDGTYIQVGTIAANRIDVNELSAISSILGTVTAGTITASTIQTSANPTVNRVRMNTDGLIGYDSVLGETFNIPTDGSPPTFSSGILRNVTIVDTVIMSSSISTSSELPYLNLSNSGLAYVETTSVGKYGAGAQYGDGTKYGTGINTWFGNPSKPVLSVEAERALADIRLFARASDPSGAAVIGDLACVGGKLKICTVAGTPGTWTIVGTQS